MMGDEDSIRETLKRLEAEINRLKRKLGETEEVPSGIENEKPRVEEVEQEIPVRVIKKEPVLPKRELSIDEQILNEIRTAFRKSKEIAVPKYSVLENLINQLDPIEASKALAALANEARLYLLKLLFYQGRYFSELEELTRLNPSPLNFHLAKLINEGLVSQERSRGRYIITPRGRVVLGLITYLWSRIKEGVKE